MPITGAAPARGAGDTRELTTVGLIVSYTKSGDGLAVAKGHSDFAVGATLSSGVGTLTFPKTLQFLSGYGSTSEADRNILVHTVDLSAGTASFNVIDENGAVVEPDADATFYLALQCGE